MKKILLVMVFVLTILLVPQVSALSVSGQKLSPITYVPGGTIVNHYTITDTVLPVEAFLDGSEIIEYIRLTELDDNEFDLIIEFPEGDVIEPGSYWFSLNVKEIGGGESAIGSVLAVRKVFRVDVLSYGKAVKVSLTAPHVNEGDPINFVTTIESKGYVDIDSVQADITVYNLANETLGTLKSAKESLPALDTKTLTVSFDTEGLRAGTYWAESIVTFDSDTATSGPKEFLIGNIELTLVNYTRVLEAGFSEFKIDVVNDWGNELRNVFATVSINGEELLQTPSISIEPWKESSLSGIMKVDLIPGDYDGEIELFYEGSSKVVPITVKVVAELEEEKEESTGDGNQTAIIIVMGVIIGMLVLGILLFLVLKSVKDKKEK